MNILSGGCVTTHDANVNVSTGNANTNTANSNLVPAETAEQVAAAPITLPILDAMFADGTFANEAKQAVQISDEQLQKLRNISRNAVLTLTENDIEERSTQAVVSEAEKKIGEILGVEKAAAFLVFTRRRWAGSDWEALATAKPSAVPTDTRIVVNTPAFRMDLFENGRLRKTYKIGIGYPEFPLPTGLRHARAIIFNPTWTPPDEPWVKGDVSPGKKVEAGSEHNPLGPIKIPIGSPSLIHGGKSPERLGTFASHGCVGLTDAQVKDFAKEIAALSGNKLSMQDIAAYGEDKTETKDVPLKTPIPVELRYETIVVEDSKLKIFRDVYERGRNTEEELRRVLQAFDVSFDTLTEPDRKKILTGLEQMAFDVKSGRVGGSNPDGRVTRNIKGKKEVVFVLEQLRGKGYPAPLARKR